MPKVEIHMAKVTKKETLKTHYSIKESDDTYTEIEATHKTEIHEDLANAFDGLKGHWALLCGQLGMRHASLETSKGSGKTFLKIDPELIKDFHVTSFHVIGDDADKGVILTGHRILWNGKAALINSPLNRYEDKADNAYQYNSELEDAVQLVIDETVQYINGKKRPDNQGKLDFDGPKEAVVKDINHKKDAKKAAK